MTPYYVLQERSAIGVGNLLHASHDTHARKFPVECRIFKFYISTFLWFTHKYLTLTRIKTRILLAHWLIWNIRSAHSYQKFAKHGSYAWRTILSSCQHGSSTSQWRNNQQACHLSWRLLL